jgi:HEPN domain-containing protein
MTKPLDIAKAMLIEGNNDYEVVPILIESGKYNLEDAVIPLEESWANSRYPNWSVEPIWIPSQQYTLDNARMSETRMRTVFEILLPFLSENYKIQI